MPKCYNLSNKQAKFCEEYLIDLNATQAAIRAGYSKKTANRIGPQNLSKVVIQAKLSELQEELKQKAIEDGDIATPEEALIGCTHDIRFDPAEMFDEHGTMLEIREMPEHVRLSLCGHKTKERIERSKDKDEEVLSRWTDIKYPDKVRCRDQLLKTLGVIKGGNGNGINVNAENVQINMTTAPLKKARADVG